MTWCLTNKDAVNIGSKKVSEKLTINVNLIHFHLIPSKPCNRFENGTQLNILIDIDY